MVDEQPAVEVALFLGAAQPAVLHTPFLRVPADFRVVQQLEDPLAAELGQRLVALDPLAQQSPCLAAFADNDIEAVHGEPHFLLHHLLELPSALAAEHLIVFIDSLRRRVRGHDDRVHMLIADLLEQHADMLGRLGIVQVAGFVAILVPAEVHRPLSWRLGQLG